MKSKQPAALPILFLTEMWERFGFYVVQGLLILYMTDVFKFSDDKGYTILGAFTALAYITPILGGFIADQILGFRKTIIIGNILLAIGYGLLVGGGEEVLYIALATIVLGTGFFKPSISSILGTFYRPGDPHREGGFTIFYIGIYIGVMMATISAGYVKEKLGWHSSFGMASIGLIIALITFLAGSKLLGHHGDVPEKKLSSSHWRDFFTRKSTMLFVVIGAAILAWQLIRSAQFGDWVLFGSSGALGIFLILEAFRREKIERNKFLALIILIITSIIFWAIYFQMFFANNLFIDRLVQRNFAGFHIPTVMFIGLEALFIFLLGPIFAYTWQVLSVKEKNPSISFKFALATIIIGVGFLILKIGIQATGSHEFVNPLWVVLSYLLITIGELLLSPIGLSMVTVLSPPNLVGMMMGVWFVALGLGGKLAGVIAKIASIPQGVTNHQIMLDYYSNAFLKYAWLGIGVGVIILLITPFLRKMEQGKNPF